MQKLNRVNKRGLNFLNLEKIEAKGSMKKEIEKNDTPFPRLKIDLKYI